MYYCLIFTEIISCELNVAKSIFTSICLDKLETLKSPKNVYEEFKRFKIDFSSFST